MCKTENNFIAISKFSVSLRLLIGIENKINWIDTRSRIHKTGKNGSFWSLHIVEIMHSVLSPTLVVGCYNLPVNWHRYMLVIFVLFYYAVGIYINYIKFIWFCVTVIFFHFLFYRLMDGEFFWSLFDMNTFIISENFSTLAHRPLITRYACILHRFANIQLRKNERLCIVMYND